MGASWTRARPVSPVCTCRIGGHRASACRREPGKRGGNLELPHNWRSNAIHHGASCRAGSRATPRAGAESTAHRQPHAIGCAAASEARSAQDFTCPFENAGTKDGHSRSEEEIDLPHLRFTRDKRGYENTFVVHTHGSGGRRRGKPRSRILYWFRTPPGVRIGRSALDEDAIRLIEQHNPDVEFDWTRILKSQDVSGEAKGSGQQERRERPRPHEIQPRRQAEQVPATPIDVPQEALEIAAFAAPLEPPTIPPTETDQPAEGLEPADVAVVEEFLVEPRVEPPAPRPQAGDALSAVEARLGSEGLSRLRARYSEVLARISETVTDPARQEELKGTAERLNPDTWVTEAEVQAGLEDYESVFESLRSVVGRRRRRGRRSSERHRDRGSESALSDSAGTQQDEDGRDEPGPADQH